MAKKTASEAFDEMVKRRRNEERRRIEAVEGVGPDCDGAPLRVGDHVRKVTPLFAKFIQAKAGGAFLGRLDSEMTADDRRKRRMEAAGDA